MTETEMAKKAVEEFFEMHFLRSYVTIGKHAESVFIGLPEQIESFLTRKVEEAYREGLKAGGLPKGYHDVDEFYKK